MLGVQRLLDIDPAALDLHLAGLGHRMLDSVEFIGVTYPEFVAQHIAVGPVIVLPRHRWGQRRSEVAFATTRARYSSMLMLPLANSANSATASGSDTRLSIALLVTALCTARRSQPTGVQALAIHPAYVQRLRSWHLFYRPLATSPHRNAAAMTGMIGRVGRVATSRHPLTTDSPGRAGVLDRLRMRRRRLQRL